MQVVFRLRISWLIWLIWWSLTSFWQYYSHNRDGQFYWWKYPEETTGLRREIDQLSCFNSPSHSSKSPRRVKGYLEEELKLIFCNINYAWGLFPHPPWSIYTRSFYNTNDFHSYVVLKLLITMSQQGIH